jgi:hypothetical protein
VNPAHDDPPDPDVAALAAGYGARVHFALSSLPLREGRVIVRPAELARRVGDLLGRSVPQTYVDRWGGGTVPRELADMLAWARALGCAAGWLYFGEGDAPPAVATLPVVGVEALAQSLSPDERLEAEVEEERALMEAEAAVPPPVAASAGRKRSPGRRA